MGRVKEEPRGRLATLQDILADGGKRLVDQAQGLRVGIERRLVEVGRGVEGQVVALVGATEERLTERLDALLNRLAVSLRKSTNAGFLGITLGQLVSLSQAVQNVILSWTRVENGAVSVERARAVARADPAAPGAVLHGAQLERRSHDGGRDAQRQREDPEAHDASAR